MDDELLDLVNEHDVVIGTINRKDYKQLVEQHLGYIRASELFIVNDQGQIWTPIRTATKTIAPNGYDYSAAGHVGAGQSYLEAMVREAKEELDMDINPDDLRLVAIMKSDDVRYFRAVYLLFSNATPVFNPEDFVSATWLAPQQLVDAIKNGHPAKTGMTETIETLVAYLAKR